MPTITLAGITLVWALIGKDARGWSKVRRKYVAPLAYGSAGLMCLSGYFQLRSALRTVDLDVLIPAAIGCAYLVAGAFVVWTVRRRA